MDFELQHTKLEGYRPAFNTVLTKEETVDSIIPDAFPDAVRIICADGRGCLLSKEVEDGGARIEGAVHVDVLYMPDGETAVCSIPLNIPFQCVLDGSRFGKSTAVHAEVISVRASARLTNPRKIFVKAEVRVRVVAYTLTSNDIVCDLAGVTDRFIQKRSVDYKDHVIGAVVEKPFAFSDVLHPSGAKPQMDELLSFRVAPGVIESKYIGKKLITKGELLLSVCYRSERRVCSARFELPFSQIIDVEGNYTEGEPCAVIALKDVSCSLENYDLQVSIEAILQAVLWSERKISLLSDAYSTIDMLDVEYSNCLVCTSAERIVRRENIRKFCESVAVAKQVIRCGAALSQLVADRNENWLQYNGECEVSVLYLDEDDMLHSAEYAIPITFQADVPRDMECICGVKTVGEVTAVSVTGGFEVRAEVEFDLCAVAYQSVNNITALRKNGAAQVADKRPSLILRTVNAGEDLWEIAKLCRSTIEDIRTANQVNGDIPEQGSILLVPVQR